MYEKHKSSLDVIAVLIYVVAVTSDELPSARIVGDLYAYLSMTLTSPPPTTYIEVTREVTEFVCV